MRFALALIGLICIYSGCLNAQLKSPKLIQFSGVVMDRDSLQPLPYVAVMVKGSQRGTRSDYYGFFNLVVQPGDRIEFSSLTHKTQTYQIPDTVSQLYYYAIQVLEQDTVKLDAVTVFPWPSKDDFRQAFLNLDLNSSEVQFASQNLSRKELTYRERLSAAQSGENYLYQLQNQYTRIYSAGQQPVNNLLNPVKWAEFIDYWRKKQKSSK